MTREMKFESFLLVKTCNLLIMKIELKIRLKTRVFKTVAGSFILSLYLLDWLTTYFQVEKKSVPSYPQNYIIVVRISRYKQFLNTE